MLDHRGLRMRAQLVLFSYQAGHQALPDAHGEVHRLAVRQGHRIPGKSHQMAGPRENRYGPVTILLCRK
jgi:hypothetical protein